MLWGKVVGVATVAATVAVGAVAAPGMAAAPGGMQVTEAVAAESGRLVDFAPDSFLYSSLRHAGAAPESEKLVGRLASTVKNNWGGIAAVNSHEYNTSFYRVASGTPRHQVAFDDCQNKGWLDPQFEAALKDVPIPANAVPAAGTDSNLSIYDPEQDTLWEFWVASRTEEGGWQACWGGKIENVSTNPGYFDGMAGSTATGLSQVGLSISVAEAQRQRIDHAMCLVVIDAKKYDDFSWPAQRSDGYLKDEDAMPQGRRLRLDPALDVDSLPLTPFAKTVARAAQEYGFVVCDKGGAVAIVTESGNPEAHETGTNPWDTLFGDVPVYHQLKDFPWGDLDVMPHNYSKPADQSLLTASRGPAPVITFAPESVWTAEVAAAPVAGDSAEKVARLQRTVADHWGGVAAIESDNMPTVYVAESTTPRVNVRFADCHGQGRPDAATAVALASVPVPAAAVPGTGWAAQMTVYAPAEDELWEFSGVTRHGDGTWSACTAAKMTQVSTQSGFFTGWAGASSTGLVNAAGAVTVAEARAGAINHAVCLSALAVRRGDRSWPAQRGEGWEDDPQGVELGRRLRLDPQFDVASAGLTPFGEAVAWAAQRYGFVVCEQTGVVGVMVESGAGGEAVTGENPWSPVFAGTPAYKQLAGFPWGSLQVLPKDYGKPAA